MGEGEKEREREGGNICLVCSVCCLSSRPSILCVNIINVLYMCVQDLRLTKCLCTPNSHMHVQYTFLYTCKCGRSGTEAIVCVSCRE